MSIGGLAPEQRAQVDAFLDADEPPRPGSPDPEEWYRRRLAAVAAMEGAA